MARDHYIPQCLTRPWRATRIGKQSLRVFDFDTGLIETKNDERCFARPGINAPETEAFFSKYVETPFAAVQDELRAAYGDPERAKRAINALPSTALVGLYLLQPQRIVDARRVSEVAGIPDLHADQIAQWGVRFLESLAASMFEGYRAAVFGYAPPPQLFFPSTAMFPIPLSTGPMMGLAIDTSWMLAFVPRHAHAGEVNDIMTSPEIATVMSVGTSRARRILIPPGFDAGDDVTPFRTLRAMNLRLLRSAVEAHEAGVPPPWKLAISE